MQPITSESNQSLVHQRQSFRYIVINNICGYLINSYITTVATFKKIKTFKKCTKCVTKKSYCSCVNGSMLHLHCWHSLLNSLQVFNRMSMMEMMGEFDFFYI